MTSLQRAENFLKSAELYKLGDLQTEARHPLTENLSNDAKDDLQKAIHDLVQVDKQALKIFKTYLPHIKALRDAIQKTLLNNHRVFFCGCGATGRLSLTIESLWRKENPGSDQVTAFMAGGDVALVHSIEGFEDFPEYGAKQLLELGFQDGDLLIGPTEGGETPYVIGAIEEAARVSHNPPWMLYCNPDEILCEKVERSKRVIENEKIRKLNLSVGPMALSGSTRMQASTVLQLACGLALLKSEGNFHWENRINELVEVLESGAELFLKGFIEKESEVYKNKDHILYEALNSEITIFTDTTERAPTFSLMPFRNPKFAALKAQPPSLSYVIQPNAKTPIAAWKALLNREPRALDWTGVDERVSTDYMMAFDFGSGGKAFREELIQPHYQETFRIEYSQNRLRWELMDNEMAIVVNPEWSHLWQQTFLKMLLNIHSTLVMGRLDRYKNNVMTWVYPTNGKLIDRTSRYVLALLQAEGVERSYEQVVHEVFRQLDMNKLGVSIVLESVAALRLSSK